MGFYPVPPPALESILTRIVPGDKPTTLLDPCAGEGVATSMIAKHLGIPSQGVFAIELHEQRGRRVTEALPEANVLTPASFFGCTIGWDCFGMVYCNPPFGDDRSSDGRIELKWLNKVATHMVPDGLLLFVCPERTTSHGRFHEIMTQRFNTISIVPFPHLHRPANEVFVIAKKNEKWLPSNKAPSLSFLQVSPSFLYRPPGSPGPLPYWTKTSLTEDEVLEKLESSPLNRFLQVPNLQKKRQPPMSLGNGHIALLLACGELDGIIRPKNGMKPHVIRGVARKVDEETDKKEEKSKGTKTTTTTITERIQTIIRAITEDGEIHTLA